MTLNEAIIGQEYKIESITTEDEELKAFLLTLGCFEGGTVTVVSEKSNNIVLAIKDGRYCIDRELAAVVNI